MDRRLIRRFREACGAGGPMAIRVRGGPGGEEVRRVLPVPFAVIGRDPKADVVLGDDEVSRRHVYVQVIGGRPFWIDLGSRNGVVAGGMVAPSGWLGEEGEIEVGPFRLAITVAGGGGGGDRPNPLGDRGPAGWPDARLEFPSLPGGPARWRIGRVVTLVGRGGDCRLRIDDGEVSRYHCALVRTPDGPWVVDLLSRTGVRLEGSRVRFGRLGPGTNLHVGRHRMVVRPVEGAPGGVDDDAEANVAAMPREQLPGVAPRRRPPAAVVERPSVEAPRVVGPPGDLDAYIGRLEQMQQQMFDQFHQMMMAMFQAFGTMQRDQMAQIREELDRIRDLGQELRSLQEAAGSAPPEAPRAAGPPSASTPREAPVDRPAAPVERPPWTPRDRTDREVHDLICRRIAEIEGERQGRWKKVLDLVKGGPAA